MKVFVGSDRIGYALKRRLALGLAEAGHEVADVGPFEEKSVEYPEVAIEVCRSVVRDPVSFGVLVCSTGIGMAIAANKVNGVRAANCTSVGLAELARLHNDANVLCLGSAVVEPRDALAMVESFIATPFEGGKHARRVEMIDRIGR